MATHTGWKAALTAALGEVGDFLATHKHQASSITDLAEVTQGMITDAAQSIVTEATQDVVGGMVVGAGGTYDDIAGIITLPVVPHDHNSIYPSRTEMNNLINAITGASVDGIVSRFGMASGTNLDTIADGVWAVNGWGTANTLTSSSGKLPALGGGILEQYAATVDSKIQRWSCTGGGVQQIWQRQKNGPAWSAWRRLDPESAFAFLATRIADATDINTVTTAGVYNTWTDASAATMPNMPAPIGGILEVRRWGTSTLQTLTSGSQMWVRTGSGSSWFPWRQVYPHPTPPPEATGSGWKRVPLVLTTGQPDADAPTSGGYLIPMRWEAPIVRWRLHVANRQPKTGEARGAVTIPAIWVGARGVNGRWSGTPTQLAASITLPGDGSEWVSEWRNDPLDGDRMLGFTYTASAAPWLLCGGGWSVSGPINGPTTLTRVTSVPLSWWVEAETYAGTPVVAVLGDSLSCGVSATTPIYDSPLSVWCRANKALPVHYANSGDHMAGFSNAADWKWTRWEHLTKPDALLWAVGSNDLVSADLPTMQARFNAVLPIAQAHTNGPIFLADLTPRDARTGTWESTRRAYNTWLHGGGSTSQTLPGDAREVYGFAAVVSSDDETLRPEYNADGIHLNTAGYAAEAAILGRLTSPAPVYPGV